jgi:coniferyl-aldehyde dehydrogenase
VPIQEEPWNERNRTRSPAGRVDADQSGFRPVGSRPCTPPPGAARWSNAIVRQARLDALLALVHDNAERFVDGDLGRLRPPLGARNPPAGTLSQPGGGAPHALALRRLDEAATQVASLWFRPGRARIMNQPLGVVGIIVPWNYPLFLAISPLAAALAAGNRVMVKMSEFTPRTGELLAELVAKYFAAEDVSVVLGDASVGADFARLPFDHLLFTGSTKVGHDIMRMAADNLTPVTLELGGKSPAIIGADYPLARAAERIMVGKLLNAGQTCIAPDYVLVPAGREQAFVEAARAVVAKCFPDMANTPDYTAIVNDRHYQRLQGYLADARRNAARRSSRCRRHRPTPRGASCRRWHC